jgi:hypothetical protein
MFDAAGGLRNGITAIGRFAGNFGKMSEYNRDMSVKADALAMYNFALNQALVHGRELKADVQLRQALMAGQTSLDDNPDSALQRAIGVQDLFQTRRAMAQADLERTNSDGTLRIKPGSPERGKKQALIDEIDSVLVTLPDRHQLAAQARKYREDGVPALFQGVPPAKDILKEGKKVGTEIQKQITPESAKPAPLPPKFDFTGKSDDEVKDMFFSQGGANADPKVKEMFHQEFLRRKRDSAKPSLTPKP